VGVYRRSISPSPSMSSTGASLIPIMPATEGVTKLMECYMCKAKKGAQRTMGDVVVCRDSSACCKRMGWTSYISWNKRK